MRVCLQWMRRWVVSVFFSVLFLFGMLSPNIVAVESQNATQADIVYTVKAGDTLYRVALEYGVTVHQLVAANNIAQPRLIRVGQKIVIPTAPATVADSSQSFGMKYTVVSGDTLSEIALRYGGTVDQLIKTNRINDSNLIYIGQILTLPISSSFTQQEILSAGGNTLGLRKDGTVAVAGDNVWNQYDVLGWTNIGHYEAGLQETALFLQLANLLGEQPDYLPTMIPLDPGYPYASVAAERTEYGYFVTFYETKVPVPINDASLNNQSIARQVATFEAIVYDNKSAAAKAVDHHDAKQGFSPYAPSIDLGYGIIGYQNSGMGQTLLGWNEGNWLLEVLHPIENQMGIDLAKNIVDELESVFLPPPNDTGRIRIVMTSPSQTETTIMWQKNEVVYRIDSTNNPIDILNMTASIK